MNYKKTLKIDSSVDKVFNFCASAYGFEKHFPYQISWIKNEEKWNLGSIIEFKFRFFFTWIYWKTEIIAYKKNDFFTDIMKGGFPYKYFNHCHLFKSEGNQTIYTDQIEFSLGFGDFIDKTIGKIILDLVFSQRHQKLKKCFN